MKTPIKLALLLGHSDPDPGACLDATGDGDTLDPGERERPTAWRYVEPAGTELLALGHQVLVVLTGTYRERLQSAERWRADLVVWCHLNAGGGDYGLVLVDARSPADSLSRRFAERFDVAAQEILPVAPVRVRDLRQGERGYSLVRTDLPVVVLEPLFLDTPGHQDAVARGGLLLVAAAIVRAIQTLE